MLIIATRYKEAYANIRSGKIIRWETVCENYYVLPHFNTDDYDAALKMVNSIRGAIEWSDSGAYEAIYNWYVGDHYPTAREAGEVFVIDHSKLRAYYTTGKMEFFVT